VANGAVYRRSFHAKKLDPYPVEILKRVDRPTTKIIDEQVPRVDERESGFNRARRFAVWGDDLLGYGKPEEKYKWWYDLEDVDGFLCIPPKSRDLEFYGVEQIETIRGPSSY
jgi:hypothetical protein